MGVVIKTPDGKFRLFLSGASEILSAKLLIISLSEVLRLMITHSFGAKKLSPKKLPTAKRRTFPRLSSSIPTRPFIPSVFVIMTSRNGLQLAMFTTPKYPLMGFNSTQSSRTWRSTPSPPSLDPSRPEIKEAVQDCHHVGVTVKMYTGDNVLPARSIASQFGLYTASGVIMEGSAFKELSDAEMT